MAEKGAVALMQRLLFNSNVVIIDFYFFSLKTNILLRI